MGGDAVSELEVFRSARLAMVSREADTLLADTDASVASELADARREADAILAQARAERHRPRRSARWRRPRRGASGAHDGSCSLRARRRTRTCATRHGSRCWPARHKPSTPRLLDRLERLARERLGEGVAIERDPPDSGGVIREAQGRRVDHSLVALVERSIAGLGEEVERLWTDAADRTGTRHGLGGQGERPDRGADGLHGVSLRGPRGRGPKQGCRVGGRHPGRASLTAQVYEYTGGLAVGDPASSDRRPFSIRLGPGLLGGVFDGILRPLATAGDMLRPEAYRSGPVEGDRWAFRPVARERSLVGPGDVLGMIAETHAVDHAILVPPGVTGELRDLVPEGTYGHDAVNRAGRAIVRSPG